MKHIVNVDPTHGPEYAHQHVLVKHRGGRFHEALHAHPVGDERLDYHVTFGQVGETTQILYIQLWLLAD